MKIRICPFCKNEHVYIAQDESSRQWFAKCLLCGVTSALFPTRERVIAWWNGEIDYSAEEVTTFTIFVLLDPRTKEPKFVGVTGRNVVARARKYFRMTKNKDRPFSKWMNALVETNERPSMRVLGHETNRGEARAVAEFWIDEYRRLGYSLLNQRCASGPLGRAPTSETRRKIGDARRVFEEKRAARGGKMK